MSGTGYPLGCAMVMTAVELARLERGLLHGQPRLGPPAEKPALAWSEAEMRAAEHRIASGLPVLRPGPGKTG